MHGAGPRLWWWLLGSASLHHAAIAICLKNVCQMVSHTATDSCPLDSNIVIALGFCDSSLGGKHQRLAFYCVI